MAEMEALSRGRLDVARFVDDESPVALGRLRGAEVLEVEREDRESAALGERHDGCVGQPEVEIGVPMVDLDRAPEDAWEEIRDLVLAGVECGEEQTRGVGSDSRTRELVDLHDHRFGHDQVAPDARDQLHGKGMSLVSPVDRCDQRSRVRDDPQRAETSV
jgi:hypothetical protein